MSDNRGRQQQPGQQPRGRGRSNRRGSRRAGPPPNFAASNLRQEAEMENQRIASILQENQQRSQDAANRPPNPRRDNLVEQGKKVLSSFFKGFDSEKRGNIEVVMDHSLPNRLTEPYLDKIERIVEVVHSSKTDIERETISKEKAAEFRGSIDLGIAAKCYASATTEERNRLFNISSVHNTEVKLPTKLGVIINQIGKTDLQHDDKIRIVGQDIMCKRHLIRGCLGILKKSEFQSYMLDGSKYDLFREGMFNKKWLDGMIDRSAASVNFVLRDIQEKFDNLRMKGFEVKDSSGAKATISFPPFNFKDGTIHDVIDYSKNNIFKFFVFNKADTSFKVASLVTLSQLTLTWLRDTTKLVGDLLPTKTGTEMDNIPIGQLLDILNLWVVNDYIEDSYINEAGVSAFYLWNESKSTYLNSYLKSNMIKFSEFGSDAQLVEIDYSNVTQNNADFREHEKQRLGINLNMIKGKAKAFVQRKNSESGAIFGSAIRYSNRVKYVGKYEIQFEGTNSQILRKFLADDFI